MRAAREVTAEEENFRIERRGPFEVIKRDPVEPEPVGTIVLKAFRIASYSRDCDGSLMARLENIDADGEETGWDADAVGLSPDSAIVVTLDEFRQLLGRKEA